MHPLILGAGLLLALAMAPGQAIAADVGQAQVRKTAAKAGKKPGQKPKQKPSQAAARPGVTSGGPGCPPAHAALHEVLLAADCSGCWSAPAEPAVPAQAWRLDWIVPAADDAPLSAAAITEAVERLQRLAAPAPSAASATVLARAALPVAAAPGRLDIASGPAWQGYLGAQLSFTLARNQALPEGSQAWLALVERLPAGSEGSPQARDLVRSLAGPLPLYGLQPGQAHTHLQALRWPEGARPERLQARGWIEGPGGQVLLMAADRCPALKPHPQRLTDRGAGPA